MVLWHLSCLLVLSCSTQSAPVIQDHIDKGEQTSNLTRRALSSEQLAYAAADVEVLIELDARMRTALPLFGPDM